MAADPRGISVQTPLGPDALFLTSFRGREGLSQLFQFQLELTADNRQVFTFDKLIGQKITISIALSDGTTRRHWTGICSSFSQSGRDSTFTSYRMEVVPQLWLLTRRSQCRIFQHIAVPDILKKVFAGLDVKLELQGTFEPRDYCVQYRESDFDFASRLMEEEGIYYFFKHSDGACQMILGNSPQTHPAMPFAEKTIYEELQGGTRPDMRVHQWEKNQELRSGKVTLWDHCFELPNQNLNAERPTAEAVEIGKVAHKLKLPANENLEIYDYPGGYAGRFDGVDRGGGDQSGNLQKIFQDNKRTAAIRMEQEAAQAILIRGSSNCRQFTAGHKFALERHYNADGAYVLTAVEHTASASANRSGGEAELTYNNTFTCLPLALPFRPPQTTPRPTIAGPQTATVVGPPGEEIHTDKYSRVKVQFPWDRQGKRDGDSSCWIRVATIWAGKGYGVIHIPRIGQEVVVEFMEGDPDQPIIIGSVYNAEQMPPAALPKNKMHSGLRSASYPSSGGFNGTISDDTKGKELILTHAQFDKETKVEHDLREYVLNNRTRNVTVNETIDIGGNRQITIHKHEIATVSLTRTHTVGINEMITVGAAQEISVGAAQLITVGAAQTISVGGAQAVSIGALQAINVAGMQTTTVRKSQLNEIGGDQKNTIGGIQHTQVKKSCQMEITEDCTVKADKKITLDGGEEVLIKSGDASILLKKDGTITIQGKEITVTGTSKVHINGGSDLKLEGSKFELSTSGAGKVTAGGTLEVKGTMVKINC